MSWTAIVPVKAWRSAKSRLDLHLREEIARALTLDTLDVLTSHPDIGHVVVVTADANVRREAEQRGAAVLAEEPADDPLNDAVRQGRDWAASAGDGPTVVVPADLAFLSTGVLSSALAALEAVGKSHVPDLDGTGTTLLAAPRASEISPHYGDGSSQLHAAAGFTRIDEVDPRARADIDKVDDFAHHASWTPGSHVSGVLASV